MTEDSASSRQLLEVDSLRVHYVVRGGLFRRPAGVVRAVDGVSLAIRRGESLGLVGESGSGKTTTGRAIVRLVKPTSGTIRFRGVDVSSVSAAELRRTRRHLQMVFQDPQGSLNPRMTVRGILSEPLQVHSLVSRRDRDARVAELLQLVGLDTSASERYPHEFSGGQQQRISIARALAVRPDLVVCDEPVSALDVSIQAQVLNLLVDLRREFGLAYLFISHDLAVVRNFCDRIGVMYLGKLAEVAPAAALYERPAHPYTYALLSAVPVPDPYTERQRRRITLTGDIPSPIAPPSGCAFHTRCWLYKQLGEPEKCRNVEPRLASVELEHDVACHFHEAARASAPSRATDHQGDDPNPGGTASAH